MESPCVLNRRAIASLSSCVLIAACACMGDGPKDVKPIPVEIADPGRDLSVLLSSFQALATATPVEQRKEYLAAREALSVESSEINRLRLALLISLPVISADDESESLRMLAAPPDMCETQGASTPVGQLAMLLCRQAQERHALHQDIRRREAELLEKQQQLEELRMKLDNLRRIDQDVMQRKHNLRSTP